MAEFSSAHVLLPPALARHVLDIGKSVHPDHLFTPAGQSGIEENPHVTIRQGLHDQKHLPLAKLLQRVRKPIQIKIGKMSLFPASGREWDKGQHQFDVLKFDVDSPHLHQLHSAIGEALDHTDTFPDYKPHVTVAYLKPGYGEKYLMDGHDLEGSQFASNLVHFSGRDGHEVPLSIGKMRRRFGRTARKYGRAPQEMIDDVINNYHRPNDELKHPILRDVLEENDDPRWRIVAKHNESDDPHSLSGYVYSNNPFGNVTGTPILEDAYEGWEIPSVSVLHHRSDPKKKIVKFVLPINYRQEDPYYGEMQFGPQIQTIGKFEDPHEARKVVEDYQRFLGATDSKSKHWNALKNISRLLKYHFPELGEPKTGDQEHDDKQLFERRKYEKPQMQGDAISAGHQIRSSNQAADMKIARTVIDRLGIGPAILQSVIHDVNDDAKPGVAAIIPHPVSPEKSLYSAAWHGLMANIPGQLVFHGHDDGEDRMYSMHLAGHGDNIRKALDQAGISQRQLIPVKGGYKVLVYDKGQQLRPQIGQFAETYDASVHESNGTGQYIGATANAGVDPLADSRKQYRSYIESYERSNPDHPTADGIKRTEPKQVHSSAITQNGNTPVSAGTVRMSRNISQKGLTKRVDGVNLLNRNYNSIRRYAVKGPRFDSIGREIPDWRGKQVFHSTDDEGEQDISSGGYRVVGDGYFGRAVSFTPDIGYAKQFGDITTLAKLSKNIKILNLNDPEHWSIYQKLTNNGNIHMSQLHQKILGAGYHGVYDAGSGDLFIYDPSKVKYIKTLTPEERSGS